MSTAIGRRMIDSGGVNAYQGAGIGRTIASKAFEVAANAAVQKVANMIKGNGIRITGGGRKRKAHKKRC